MHGFSKLIKTFFHVTPDSEVIRDGFIFVMRSVICFFCFVIAGNISGFDTPVVFTTIGAILSLGVSWSVSER
jgi:hypothetical protein